MKRLLPLLLLALCLAPAIAAPAAPPGTETLRHRIPVPSPEQPQGEVRIVQRGKAMVVQTLLYTKILKRVVGAICKKEQATWPQQRPEHGESKRYVETLRQIRQEIEGERKAGATGNERLQTLLIEFVLDEQQSSIGLYEPTYGGEDGQLVVRDRRPLAVWPASRRYISENMLEIVKDAFALDDAAAKALLAGAAATGKQ